MKTIQWGIVGCGDVTEVKSGPALQKAEGSELVAVMRRNAEKAADYAQRHGVPTWYSDAEALIHDPQVNAVYVATPPSSHHEYTVMAAKAGKPILVEKPMALTTAECESMIEACKEANVPLFVAYYRRKLPRFEKMRELVQTGAIGAVRSISIRHFKKQGAMPGQSWKVDPTINGGGYFVDMQAHMLDWMDHVFGPPLEVQGLATRQTESYAAEDAVSISLKYAPNILASGIFSYASGREEEEVTIYGSTGEISMGFFRASPVKLLTDEGEEVYDLPDPAHVHQPLVQTIVDELQGGPPSPSTGITAMRTTRVIQQVLATLEG